MEYMKTYSHDLKIVVMGIVQHNECNLWELDFPRHVDGDARREARMKEIKKIKQKIKKIGKRSD